MCPLLFRHPIRLNESEPWEQGWWALVVRISWRCTESLDLSSSSRIRCSWDSYRSWDLPHTTVESSRSPPLSPSLSFTLLLSVCCLYFSCLFSSLYPVSFWPANFNLKLDWADLMQIPPGKTLKLMNSYVKSILHHREKVTSARKKTTRLKRQGLFTCNTSAAHLVHCLPSLRNCNCQN